ncbi:MAG TPA: hypothetical protein VGL77_10630 [Armatimonadota bacterium]|jgi:hypothetical protein
MRLRTVGALLAALVLCTSMSMASSSPFTPEFLARLSLTPAQSTAAQRIAQGMNRALLVSVYSDADYSGYYAVETRVPIDQLIAMRTDALRAELMRRHPNSVAVEVWSREIAHLKLQRKEILAAGYADLAALLTPEQQKLLAPLPNSV